MDPNVRDANGETALTVAAYRGHSSVIQTLVSLPGTDLFLTNQRGQRAWEIALDQGHMDAALLLQEVIPFSTPAGLSLVSYRLSISISRASTGAHEGSGGRQRYCTGAQCVKQLLQCTNSAGGWLRNESGSN